MRTRRKRSYGIS